ncbi:MAG: type III pantothenate kinase [Bacteroidota bacterium]
MLLAIDAGNTDIVFGLYDGQSWLHQWRVPSREAPSTEAWQYRLVSELFEKGIQLGDVKQAIISSVVPDLTQPLAAMLRQANGIEALIVGPEVYPQLELEVLNPDQIGTDLVANALAAYHRYKDHCIVVDFGTALTFTTISAEASILGVAIAPGLKTAIRSLFQDTAQLPEVPLQVPESAIGKNTIHAIQAGTMLGYIGMVTHLLQYIKEELSAPDCKVVATGGLSSVLKPLSTQFDRIDPLLTLDGLVLIDAQARQHT